MNKLNVSQIENADSYKASHFKLYAPGTENISSYIEARGFQSDHDKLRKMAEIYDVEIPQKILDHVKSHCPTWSQAVFFGLQMFIKEYLSKPITMDDIDAAEKLYPAHGEPFNREGWLYILNHHNGYLPVEIEAVDEGTVLPLKNVMVQVINTDPKCAWVTSYLETALMRLWYPITVATLSWEIKQDIMEALELTSDNPLAAIAFMLNDFGSRGVSSLESSAIGGAAHLVNFQGTDNVPGILAAINYYNASGMPGFSIPASEHSTITSWGGKQYEPNALENMLDQFAKKGTVVACVSDSYDIYHACNYIWGELLKKKIIESGARLVVRPDSGDPTTIPVECVKILMDKFGYRTNSKGFKILPDYIRVIQGDGIEQATIRKIMKNLIAAGFAVENVCFGMGGALLQQINRDTLKFAMKASAANIKGNWIDVFKDPITDSGKKSKRGRLALIKEDGVFKTIRCEEAGGKKNYLNVVWRNGKHLRTTTYEEVRERSNATKRATTIEEYLKKAA